MPTSRAAVLCGLLLACVGCVEPKQPTLFKAKVVGIKDGDTFAVLADGKEVVIRLANVDCPEKSQPFGKAAKQFASDLCFEKDVEIRGGGKADRYGRIIATVCLNDSVWVNKELVKAGMAWHFLKYSTDTTYASLERSARSGRVGLWADSTAIPPWEWRKSK